MKLNPKKLVLTVCLGAVVSLAGLAGCQSHGDRTAGRYMDDRKIASRVRGDLKDSPVFKFPDVQVAAYDGVVQLSGFVDTQQQKNQASQIAQHTDGVREVVNSLVIKPQVTQTGPAPVINNENRITTTPSDSPTGHRIDAQSSSTRYTGGTTGTTITSGTTTTGNSSPSGATGTQNTTTTGSGSSSSKNIESPSVNINTPSVNISTNNPSNQ